jgi:predicted nucleic acid-binding protein
MNFLVLDNSAAIALLKDTSESAQEIRSAEIYAPEVIDLEFASVIRKMLAQGKLGIDEATQLISTWASNGVVRCAHRQFLQRIWQVRENITAYDASYVALAEHLGFPLFTADLRLAKSAERYCEVVIVGNSST